MTLLDRLVERHAMLGETVNVLTRERSVLRRAITEWRLGRDERTVLALMDEQEPGLRKACE